MTLYEFQRAFEKLASYGSSIWEQGFDANKDCNANALRYFEGWLEQHAGLFQDGEEQLAMLRETIAEIYDADAEEDAA